MAKKIKNRQTIRKIKMIHVGMILGYAALVMLTVTIVTQLALRKTDSPRK